MMIKSHGIANARNLSVQQEKVLEWLAGECLDYEKQIFGVYKKIGKSLKMTKWAARGRVDELKLMGLISTRVCYKIGKKNQAVGLAIKIDPVVYEQIFSMEITTIKKDDITERMKMDALLRVLRMDGYHNKPALGGYSKVKVVPKKREDQIPQARARTPIVLFG